MPGRTVKVGFDLFARDKASPVFDKFGREVKKSEKAVGGFASGGVKKLVGAFAGMAVLSKASGFLKDATAEARESQKVNAQTANALKVTGASAWASSKQIGDLAGALSNKTAVDDEAIQTGANLLLTFKAIRNEAGKGNDVFNRATAAAVDLSAAGFGSIESASILMGKALNDPIKGMSALGKSGVTFTQQQKDQIKALQESGDMLGAQKIILKEVESQVKGSAEAQATAGEKAAVAWANFKETIGTALLPVLDRFFTLVSTKIIPGLLAMGPVFQDIGGFIGTAIGYLRGFGDAGGEAGGRMAQLTTTVVQAWANIRSTFQSAISIIRSLWATFGSSLVSYAQASLTNLMTILRGAFNVIAGIFKTVAALLRGDWRGVWDGIKQILRGAVQVLIGVVRQFGNMFKTAFRLMGAAVRAIFRGIWSGIRSLASAGISSLMGLIRGVPGKLRGLASSFKSAGTSLIKSFVNGLSNAGSFVSNIAGHVKDAVRGAINSGIDKINSYLKLDIDWPGPGSFKWQANIPHLAKGGIVRASRGGTLAVIGEAGHDEAVVPLSGPNAPAAISAGGVDPAVLAAIFAPLLEEIRNMREDLKTLHVQVTLGVDRRTAAEIVQMGSKSEGRLG